MVKTRESEVAIVAVGLIFVALGIGLIALKPWARNVTIGLHIVNGVGALAQSNGVSLVVVALILQYLFSQKVRELFERNGKIIKSVKLGTEQEGEVTEVYPQTR